MSRFFICKKNRLSIFLVDKNKKVKWVTWRDLKNGFNTIVALSQNNGIPVRKLKELQMLIEERKNEISHAWKKHFAS